MEIKITKTIPYDVLESVIVTAMEGGSNYWYWLSDLSMLKGRYPGEPLSIRIAKAVFLDGIDIPVHDCEDPQSELGTLKGDAIQERLQALADDQGLSDHLDAELRGEGDATSSDVVFQFMVMGELVYS